MSQLPPSEGERRALGGYVPQYLIASQLILEHLRNGNFEYIRLVDPEAGRLDDIQIGSTNRVDAFQVKWSQYPSNITFLGFVQPADDATSLLEQLADGWKKLRVANPDKRIVVHLISNDTASPNDKETRAGHFAEFVKHAWTNRTQTDFLNSDKWKEMWNVIQKVANFSLSEFLEFIANCELDLRYADPLATGIRELRAGEYHRDLIALFQYLLLRVSQSQGRQAVVISRDELLKELGWKQRIEFRNKHEYPLTEYYIPNEISLEELNHKLNQIEQGYLSLVGPAGSGKSTLLSQSFTRKHEHVIRYYAYVPDDLRLFTRGESSNFFHDLNQSMARYGISNVLFDDGSSLDIQRSNFTFNLALLGKEWQENGIKTVIVIDGIDHIPREQKPEHSFLQELPLPHQIPVGVVVLLGTRSDQLADLPVNIQIEINRPERKVEIQPLAADAVEEIISKHSSIPLLTKEQTQKILSLSEGNPLALEYILKRLEDETEARVNEILEKVPAYEGDIQNEYEKFWRRFVRNNIKLSDLLGLIARVRNPISLDWITTSFPDVYTAFVEASSQYFRLVSPGVWQFYHSSFRLYLEKKTIALPSGESNLTLDKEYHARLASLFSQLSTKDPNNWETLFHLYRAGKLDEIFSFNIPDRFREQFLALRRLEYINNDIHIVMQAAVKRRNMLGLTQALLLGAEFDQRSFYLNDAWFSDALLRLGNFQVALSQVKHGQTLLIDAEDALSFSSLLVKQPGFETDAEFIFRLAEPRKLLTIDRELRSSEDFQGSLRALLQVWASTAPYFRPLHEAITWIRSLRYIPDQHEKLTSEAGTQQLQAKLLEALGMTLVDEKRLDDLNKLIEKLDISISEEATVCFYLYRAVYIEFQKNQDKSSAQTWFRKLLDLAGAIHLDEQMRTHLSQGAYRILGDLALSKEYIDDISQPKFLRDVAAFAKDISPFAQRFLLNRMLRVHGDKRTLSEIIPDTNDSEAQQFVLLERAICSVSHLWAEAWLGNEIQAVDIRNYVISWILFFYHDKNRDWSTEYTIRNFRASFYELLISAVSMHGTEALTALKSIFETEWNNSPHEWSIEIKRKIILEFAANDLQFLLWATEQLSFMQPLMYEGQDIGGRIEACKEQFAGWLKLGQIHRAGELVQELLATSFGIGYRKDYQLNDWMEWLNLINQSEPENATERMLWFAQAIVDLEETTEGRAAYEASKELVNVAYNYDPDVSLQLFREFLRYSVISHDSGILELLLAAAEKDTKNQQSWIIAILGDFIFRFIDSDYGAYRLKDLLLKLAKNLTPHEQEKTLRLLVDKSNIYVQPKIRADWQHSIAEAAYELDISLPLIGLNEKELHYSWHSDHLLKLSDGREYYLDQVNNFSTNFYQIHELMELEAEDSSFDWIPILANITVPNDKLDDFAQFLTERLNKYHKAEVILSLAKNVAKQVSVDRAWHIALEALKYSNNRSWSADYGTAKLKIFRFLREIRPSDALELAWSDFENNIAKPEFISHFYLATNLIHILPILFPSTPITEAWGEIERYIQNLIGKPHVSGKINLNLSSSLFHQHSLIYANLVLDYVGHPVHVVADGAAYICGTMLLQEDNSISDAIARRVVNSGDVFGMYLCAILQAVALEKPHALETLKPTIMELCKSPNLAIRYAAYTISRLVGIRANLRLPTELPPIYQLVLPDVERPSLESSMPLPGTLLPDSDLTADFFRLYQSEIRDLSRLSGLAYENIRARMKQILLTMNEPWGITSQDEKNLRQNLDRTGLKFAYVRPRWQIVQAALFRAAAELYDARYINDNYLEDLSTFLQFCDPKFVLSVPSAKPQQVVGVLDPEDTNWYPRNNWVNEFPDNNWTNTLGDSIVVGEYTVIEVVSDGNATETRLTQICSRRIKLRSDVDEPHHFFKSYIKGLYSEYEILVGDNDPALVISNDKHDYITPADNWLAFNPHIAREFGWHLSNRGIFRWTDAAGEIAVESIWWVNGFNSYDRIHGEVGEGWLVIASPKAWQQIADKFPDKARYGWLCREYYEHRQQKPLKKFKLVTLSSI